MNILEFPSHICKDKEDSYIINLIKNFFEETICLYNIIELEHLFNDLSLNVQDKENFTVTIFCSNENILKKLIKIYNNTEYIYYNKKIHVLAYKEKDLVIMQFKMVE